MVRDSGRDAPQCVLSVLFVFLFLSTFQWPTSSKWDVYSKVTKFLSQELQEIYKMIRATILRDNIPKHWCHLALPLRRIILLWQHSTTRHKQRTEDCRDRGSELKCVIEQKWYRWRWDYRTSVLTHDFLPLRGVGAAHYQMVWDKSTQDGPTFHSSLVSSFQRPGPDPGLFPCSGQEWRTSEMLEK